MNQSISAVRVLSPREKVGRSTYGVCFKSTGAYVDTSLTERGAKNHATRHGYDKVYRRSNGSYHIELVATRVNNRWYGPNDMGDEVQP